MSKAIVIFSGGLDSTVCLYKAKQKYGEAEALAFSYGQKHSVELECAKQICEKENVKLTIIDISFLNQLAESALLSAETVLGEHFGPELPAAFVPNRNMLFLTLGHTYALKAKADALYIGVCCAETTTYPDARPKFIESVKSTFAIGNGTDYVKIETPIMYASKEEIFKMALDLNKLDDVINMTHTCYNGDHTNKHAWGYGCGKCQSCIVRAEGFNHFKRFN